MKRLSRLLLVRLSKSLLFSTMVLTAQIAQDHPELCGAGRAGTSIPTAMTVTMNSLTGESDLILTTKAGASRLKIPGVMKEVQQACPLSNNQVLLFGLAAPSLYNLALANTSTGALIDSFYAFSPAISPNQRWVIMRKFYPLGGITTTVSEEYLLYDVKKGRAENRADPRTVDSYMEAGRAVYPLGQKKLLGDNIGVPENQGQQMGARIEITPNVAERCKSTSLVLYFSDFKSAGVEKHNPKHGKPSSSMTINEAK